MPPRFIFMAMMCAFLAGCGFTPVYAPARQNSKAVANIVVLPMAERAGQALRNHLLDRGFSASSGAAGDRLALSFEDLTTNEIDLGLAPDSTATRRQLSVSGVLKLTQNGAVRLQRRLSARGTYNVLISQYSTIIARDKTQDQALNDLAAQIETQAALLAPVATP